MANEAPLTAASLPRYVDGWLLTCEVNRCSPRTVAKRRLLMDKFLWWLRRSELAEVDRSCCRAFLHYVSRGHLSDGGRWGTGWKGEVKASTVNSYHGTLRTFFGWIRDEEERAGSPMDRVEPAIDRADQVEPFTADQVEALIRAARAGRHAKRDFAILLFLLDTGVRISELCGLRVADLDLMGYGVTVLGKGDKRRRVQFGRATKRALWQYLHARAYSDEECVFVAEGGQLSGEPLTPNGVLQMVRRLGRAAGITGVRCSPHTCRHTFAVNFLRNGGNQFALMTMLGHTGIAQTARYVAYVQADIERQHREFGPVDRMARK